METRLARAKANVLNSVATLPGLLALVVVLGAIYLFSGFIAATILFIVKLVGGVLLLGFGVYLYLDSCDKYNPTQEDVDAGITRKEYILRKFKNNEQMGARLFKTKDNGTGSDEEVLENLTKQYYTKACVLLGLVVLFGVYTLYGYAPALGVLAVIAVGICSLMRASIPIMLEQSLLNRLVERRQLGATILNHVVYGIPMLYIGAIFYHFIFG